MTIASLVHAVCMAAWLWRKRSYVELSFSQYTWDVAVQTNALFDGVATALQDEIIVNFSGGILSFALMGYVVLCLGKIVRRAEYVNRMSHSKRSVAKLPIEKQVRPQDVFPDECCGHVWSSDGMCDSARVETFVENTVCREKIGNARVAGGVRVGRTLMRPFVPRQCSCNMLRAICLRQCLAKGVDKDGNNPDYADQWQRAVCNFNEFRFFEDHELGEVTDEVVSVWQARFPKKTQRAFDRVRSDRCDGLVAETSLKQSEFRVTTFVKKENTIPKEEPDGDLDASLTDPRCICNGTYEQQVNNGVRWWLVGNLFKKVFSAAACVVYAGGLNGQQIASIYKDVETTHGTPFCVWTDCSRWDGRLNKAALQAEVNVMKTIPGFWQELVEFMEKDMNVDGESMDGSVKFSVKGTRKSGRNDTSVGNSILNAIAHLYALMKCGFTMREILLFVKLIFMGDDNIMFIAQEIAWKFNAEKFEAELKKFGLKPEVGFTDDPIGDRANFLSSIWLPAGDEYLFITLPERNLVKGVFQTTINQTASQWAPDVFMTHYATYCNIPVMGAYWKRLMELYPHGKVKVDENKAIDVSGFFRNCGVVTLNTRVAFEQAYGISPKRQREAEEYLLLDWDPRFPANHPVLTDIVRFNWVEN